MAATAISPAFVGFPDRAIGGYVAGLLAGSDPMEVRFRAAVPVGVELELVEDSDRRQVMLDGTVLAVAVPARSEVEVPAAPDPDVVAEATAHYIGHHYHPFPGCFCCGTAREPGDGLRVFTGPIDGTESVAAHWTLHPGLGQLGPEHVWAALDCPAIWSLIVTSERGSSDKIVTGTMSGRTYHELEPGATYTVHGWKIGAEGRRRLAAAAITAEDGTVMAAASQVFVTTDFGVPLDFDMWSPR